MTAVPSGWTPEQARKRLEAATSGPWTVATYEIFSQASKAPLKRVGFVPEWMIVADAEFIANAPTDIRALLALLDDATIFVRTVKNYLPGTPMADSADDLLARFAADDG